MNSLSEIGDAAGSITAVLGLLALVLFDPVKKAVKQKREEREKRRAERLQAERAAKEDEEAFRCEVRKALKEINGTLVTLTDDVGDLQYERLSQAQDFYTAQGWCPGSKKEMLCEMHKSYRKKGRNHLSEHYEEEIMRLDSKPKTANVRGFETL